METVSKAAGAASRAIFGQKDETARESGREPVSGLTGAGKPEDPYDGGNREDSGLGGAPGLNAQPASGAARDNVTDDRDNYQTSQPGISTSASYRDAPGQSNYGDSSDQTYKQGASVQSGNPTGSSDKPSSMLDPDGDGSMNSGAASSSTYTANDRDSTNTDSTSNRLPNQYTSAGEGYQDTDNNRYTSSATTTDYSSQRLPGQEDTPNRPSGGIAQDGIPQGRNVIGPGIAQGGETERTGRTGVSSDPKPTVDYPSSSNADSTGGHAGLSRGTIGGFGTAEPSVGADPSSGQKPTLEHQGAERPHDEPSEEAVRAIRQEKEAVERTARGGSGNNSTSTSTSKPHSLPAEDHSSSESRGTGEKWIKSTGTAADGGDFDAAKPGAGKECDRLLEQQGVHRAVKPGAHSEGMPGESAGGKHGHGVGEKLKEKLHHIPHHTHHIHQQR